MSLPIPYTVAALFNVACPDLIFLPFILLPLLGFPIWMLIDCIKRESDKGNTKLIWVLVIIIAPFGSLIYFFARKLRRSSLPPPVPQKYSQ